MSKKHKKNNFQQASSPAPQAQLVESSQQPAGVNQNAIPEADQEPHVFPKKYFFAFWAVVALAVVIAWVLPIMLPPDVSESLVERWVMAGLAAALGVLLFLNK